MKLVSLKGKHALKGQILPFNVRILISLITVVIILIIFAVVMINHHATKEAYNNSDISTSKPIADTMDYSLSTKSLVDVNIPKLSNPINLDDLSTYIEPPTITNVDIPVNTYTPVTTALEFYHENSIITQENSTEILATEVASVESQPVESYYDFIPLDTDIQSYIQEKADEAEIPIGIIYGIANTESGFRPDAISSTDDHGMYQLNKCNFTGYSTRMGVTYDEFTQNIYDPKFATDVAISMLTCLRTSYPHASWSHILVMYNLGPGGGANIESSYYSQVVLAYANDNFGFAG